MVLRCWRRSAGRQLPNRALRGEVASLEGRISLQGWAVALWMAAFGGILVRKGKLEYACADEQV